MKEARQGRGSRRLTFQISCECVHCVGFQWPKTTTFGKFWLFGDPIPAPITDEGNIWCAKADQTSNFIWVCLFCRLTVAKNHNVWQILNFGGVSIGLFYRPLAAKNPNFWKLNTGAQLQTFPYPTASKSFLHSNGFMAKNGRTDFDVHKRDEETKRDGQKSVTNRQKTQRCFANPTAGEIRATPNLVRW